MRVLSFDDSIKTSIDEALLLYETGIAIFHKSRCEKLLRRANSVPHLPAYGSDAREGRIFRNFFTFSYPRLRPDDYNYRNIE